MAGTCEVATPATILAMVLAGPLGLEPVAVWRATAIQHHGGVVRLAHPGHRGRELLERQAVGGAELGGEVDIAAELNHAVPITRQERLLLIGGHREPLQIAGFVGFERLAIVRLHQRHAELVEPIALPRALGVEHRGARDVVVVVHAPDHTSGPPYCSPWTGSTATSRPMASG